MSTNKASHTARAEQQRLENLSPFELKDRLISLADENHERGAMAMLNAGRGNPNWIATVPREAFFLLGRFGIAESKQDWDEWADLGGMPAKHGIAQRLSQFLTEHRSEPGADLLREGVSYGIERLGFDPDSWVHELTDCVIGDNYPVPDRMLHHAEQVVHEYLMKEMCGGQPPYGHFDLFATEGGTAAMCYIFDSAIINRLLHPGDSIAIMTPIFTPYLEIPQLERYQFNVVELQATQTNVDGFHTWQYPDSEIDKLADPAIKALFCVNPSNPPSVTLAPQTLDRISRVIRERNPGLMIITDDVYGTFVNDFRSLMSAVPSNTIGVYSFSKYFGATGWRLGVIAIHSESIFAAKLAELPAADKEILNKRYSTITLEPEKLSFIDRMVADSRQVALNHTSGLSLPQQCQMVLFSLYALLDEHDEYKRTCQTIIARRLHALVKGLGVELPKDPLAAHYYVELDLLSWAERHWGADFARWMRDKYEPVDPIFSLAEKGSVVLLNGGGFDGPKWSVRVSLANLRFEAYQKIGDWLREIGEEYRARYRAEQAQSQQAVGRGTQAEYDAATGTDTGTTGA